MQLLRMRQKRANAFHFESVSVKRTPFAPREPSELGTFSHSFCPIQFISEKPTLWRLGAHHHRFAVFLLLLMSENPLSSFCATLLHLYLVCILRPMTLVCKH